MKTIHGIGLLSAGLLLSSCDSPVAVDDALPGSDAPIEGRSAPANPFAGASLHVDTYHPANATIAAWRESRPADASLLERIAGTPQAVWLTGGSGDVTRARSVADAAASAGAVPVFVLYNIPVRDCGGYSGNGGAATASGYRGWISAIADGLSGRRSVVVLEPDALAAMGCLSASGAEERVALLAEAVRVLEAAAAAVYLDAGNARWHSVEEMASRLERAGIADAHGFALNVSNFIATPENVRYGDALSSRLGGMGYIVDTGRNGLGPSATNEWCNPPGRALGPRPHTNTGEPLADAFLWIKQPGFSDGPCNGGPAPGVWWADYALGLASRSPSR
jgi:endoglucanase